MCRPKYVVHPLSLRRELWTKDDQRVERLLHAGNRIDTARAVSKAKGMGLGLAICRMIIERHSGQLTASSDGKRGALFQFVLPTEPGDKAAFSANVQSADRKSAVAELYR